MDSYPVDSHDTLQDADPVGKASFPAFGGSSPPVGPGMCQWRTSGQLPGEGCCLRYSEMTTGQHL